MLYLTIEDTYMDHKRIAKQQFVDITQKKKKN